MLNEPLILLHGALGSRDQLKNLSEALQTEGFTVYTMNFSGHGGEPFSDTFSIEQFSAELKKFIDDNSLHGVDVFGYSMGGYVALWLQHTHPGYCGKIMTLGTKFDWSPESSAAEIRKLDPVKIEHKVPQFATMLEERHMPNDWRTVLERTASMMISLGKAPLLTHEILKNIEGEVLIAVGDADDTVDRSYSEHVAATLPEASFALLEETPHPIEKINTGELAELITAFVNK